jgi:pseudouridine synthase
VTIDGVPAVLGSKADPALNKILVNGKLLRLPETKHYLMLNKPPGYLSSRSDPENRPTIMALVPRHLRKLVYPVGRLDADAEGLLFLFDDGDLTNLLTHPRYEVPRTYRVWVAGGVGPKALRDLRQGVVLADGRTAPAHVKLLGQRDDSSVLEMTIHEGRKHQVKRMCERVGHPVQRLMRVSSGGVELGDLAPGKIRPLTAAEVERLRKSARIPDTPS